MLNLCFVLRVFLVQCPARARLVGSSPLSLFNALNLGVSGPLLRSTGIPWDNRLCYSSPFSPLPGYSSFRVPTGSSGDNFDRFFIRLPTLLVFSLSVSLPFSDLFPICLRKCTSP